MKTQTIPDNLKRLSLILVLIGVIISSYLSYTKLTETNVICLESNSISCDVVQNSVYAQLAGIEIAYLGLFAYLILGGLLLLEQRIPILQAYGPMLMFGATLFAFLYALWLIYVQAVLLAAFCTWCLAHEVTMTLLFLVSALRLWQFMRISDD